MEQLASKIRTLESPLVMPRTLIIKQPAVKYKVILLPVLQNLLLKESQQISRMGLLARDEDSTHSTKTCGSMDLISHKVPVMRQIKIQRVVPGLSTEDSSITAFDLKTKEL